jgi:hypothetical protein
MILIPILVVIVLSLLRPITNASPDPSGQTSAGAVLRGPTEVGEPAGADSPTPAAATSETVANPPETPLAEQEGAGSPANEKTGSQPAASDGAKTTTSKDPGGFRWTIAEYWPDSKVEWGRAVVLLGTIIFAGVAARGLPSWWWVYARVGGIRAALLATGEDGKVAAPYFESLAGFVRSLLPARRESAELREASLPFIQEELKRVLEYLVGAFGRVVVLIDDIDVLPMDAFAHLLQVLRPLSKVHGVSAAVCAPTFWYEALRVGPKGDIHSTLQECFLLEDVDWEEQCEALPTQGAFTAKECAQVKDMFKKRIRPLLEARWKFNGYDEDKGKFVEKVLEVWARMKEDQNLIMTKVVNSLKSVRPTRRDWLRETARLLENPNALPFDILGTKKDRLGRQADLNESKAAYGAGSQVLNVHVEPLKVEGQVVQPPEAA